MWVTKADGSSANYDYNFRCDDMGRFEKILGPNLGLMFQYSYDPASNEWKRHNEINGVDQSYDPIDELNRRTKTDVLYKNALGNNAHAVETYSYWNNGLMHTVTRGNKQDLFGYYLNGELHQVNYGILQTEGASNETPPAEDPTKEKTVDDLVALSDPDPNGVLTADRTVIYTLDGAGNRTGVNDSNIGPTAYFPDNINVYRTRVGGDAIDNGTNHEVISYKNVSYTYRDEHLTNVISISGANSYDLAYDALGRCVKRTINGLTKYYIYDGEKPILEYGPLGNLRGKNLYGKGIDEILMRYDPTLSENRTYYYQQDHDGSVIYLTTPDGKLLEKYRYDVFGTPTIRDGDNHLLPNGSSVSNRFMFTGREYAAAFKFYEYRARAYHPGLGRFMSEDPKLFVHRTSLGKALNDWSVGAHPDEAEFNLFRYCGNDPLNFTDPMGLESPGWARAIIPGQIEWDNAVANWNAGNHATAVGWGVTMAAQQTLAVATLGTSMRIQESLQAARVALTERQAIMSVASAKTATTTLAKFYPESGGFIGATKRTWLMPGEIVDRYGGTSSSKFFSPAGTPGWERSLPPGTASQTLRTFEVVKPFEVQAGKVAAWFNQSGGSTAYQSTIKLETLLKRGILREITR
jgi:RHS repeat-associated protein